MVMGKTQYLSEASILNIFKQSTEGLIELHKNNIVHRDIKPANIFLIKKENKEG